LQASSPISFCNHASVRILDGITLDVVVNKTRKLSVAWSQHGITILEFIDLMFLERTVKDLACLFSLTLNHECQPQNVVSLKGISVLV